VTICQALDNAIPLQKHCPGRNILRQLRGGNVRAGCNPKEICMVLTCHVSLVEHAVVNVLADNRNGIIATFFIIFDNYNQVSNLTNNRNHNVQVLDIATFDVGTGQ
jgi:hypothetical protein